MFDMCSLEAKNTVLEFDSHKMNMFKSARCSQNDVGVHSMFDKIVLDPSLLPLLRGLDPKTQADNSG